MMTADSTIIAAADLIEESDNLLDTEQAESGDGAKITFETVGTEQLR
jgi:hypothetical protein